MTTIGNLKLYDIFRKDLHLPDNKAMEAVTALDDFFDKKSSGKIALLATKEELVATRNELVATKNELKQEIHSVATRLDLMATKQELYATRNELKQEIHSVATKLDLMATKEELFNVKTTLTSAIHATEIRLTRSMYGVTLAQMLVLIGAVYYFFKYAGVVK